MRLTRRYRLERLIGAWRVTWRGAGAVVTTEGRSLRDCLAASKVAQRELRDLPIRAAVGFSEPPGRRPWPDSSDPEQRS